jgi:hypothetical protein
MKISRHAAVRFLQRVIQKTEFTGKEVYLAIKYLEKALSDIVLNSYAKSFALPGFEKEFCVVAKENTAVTIIPKEYKGLHYEKTDNKD